MGDKITTVAKEKLGDPIGRLDDDVVRLNGAIPVFLGLAGRRMRDDGCAPTA